MDEAFEEQRLAPGIDGDAVEIVLQHVVGLDQRRRHAARHQIAIGVLVVPHRDMTEAVDHAEISQHMVGDHEILDQLGVGCAGRLGLRQDRRAGHRESQRQ